jgi:iduronate 2-sulfatase
MVNIKDRVRATNCSVYLTGMTCILISIMGQVSCMVADKNLDKPNILLICIDDLRPELNSFGASYIKSPHIDALARQGVSFLHHYVNAPSCGPSRYTLLTGRYGPTSNNALFQRASLMTQDTGDVYPSMPEWFRSNGYTTVSVGKVSHHPGGLGGDDWNDPSHLEMPNAWDKHLMPSGEWLHPRGAMHGLANGEIRIDASTMDVIQAVEGDDTIYPDGNITNEAIKQLKELSAEQKKPFFLAVGIIRPHLPFGAPKSYLDLYDEVDLPSIVHPQKPSGKTTWHESGEFMKYNRWDKDMSKDKIFADKVRRHYAACVSFADAQVGKLLQTLKESGRDKNTIVVLWGDHGWHLGEHAIWGKHSLFEESLHSPLIISYPNKLKSDIKQNTIVQTLDVFPTLCEISGLDMPAFTQGKSLVGIMNILKTQNNIAIAYKGNAKTIRTTEHRLILHDDGYAELYDHTTDEAETQNIAELNPAIVNRLSARLEEILN